MWLLFAFLAGALYTAEGLTIRHLLRAKRDPWAFSFFYSLVGTAITLPFMLAAPVLPQSPGPWLLAIVVSLLIVAHNFLVFKASGLLEASLIGAISKLRLVWVFALGIVVLHDGFSWEKLLGTLLAIAAGLVILHNFKRPDSATGLTLAFSATFFNAGIIILAKYLFGTFNAVSLTFFAFFLVPLILNFVLMPDAVRRIKKLYQENRRLVLVTCGLGALANLALNQALALHDASSVLVISEIFLILILVGEHALLKEKEYLWVKVVSVVLAVAGAVLIHISQ
jgi:drug/metabolite transporter (DMT)-like permease